MTEPPRPRPKPIYHAVGGFLAGSLATTLLFPLDLIKVRFQVDKGQLPTIFAKFRGILTEEGLGALFKGLTPALSASAVSWAGFFFIYEQAKSRRRDVPTTKGRKMLADALNSMQAGAIMVFITNPLWLVKTRLQLQRDAVITSDGAIVAQYRGMVDALTRIPREEGLAALYRGVLPALFLTSHGAIQLCVYEELKRFREPSGPTAALALVYGSLAKLAASIATYPYQVVKTRIQQRFPSSSSQQQPRKLLPLSELIRTYTCIAETFKYEGIRGFFKGVWPNSLRVIPSAAITFWAYELIVRKLPSSSFSDK